jgi:hypothetical protein
MIVCHGTATPVPPPPSPPQHSPCAAAGRKPSASPCSNHPGQAPAVPQQLPRPGGSRAPARAAAIRAGRQPSASPCSNHPGQAPAVPQQLPRPGGSRAPARAAAIRAGRQPSASPCSNHPGPAPVGQLQPSPRAAVHRPAPCRPARRSPSHHSSTATTAGRRCRHATALSICAGLATSQSPASPATLNPFLGIETEDPLPIAHIRSDCCQKIRCFGALYGKLD